MSQPVTDKSSSLIDLIYTNSLERVVCSGVAHVGISDHSLVYVYPKLSFNLPEGHSPMTYRTFKHLKRSVFLTDISNHNCDFLRSSKDLNELWSEWKSNFLATADKNAPIRTLKACAFPQVTLDYSRFKKTHA